jgi:hypothetical protein
MNRKVLQIGAIIALLLFGCNLPTKSNNSPPIVDPASIHNLNLSFDGENMDLDVASQQACTLTSVSGHDQSSEHMVTAFIHGLTSGGYDHERVNFVISYLPASSRYDSITNSYGTGTIKYDVIDSIRRHNPTDPSSELDTFCHKDSVVSSVAATINIGGTGISGSFSGTLGAENPTNFGKHYRLDRPLDKPVQGTFTTKIFSKMDCAGNPL